MPKKNNAQIILRKTISFSSLKRRKKPFPRLLVSFDGENTVPILQWSTVLNRITSFQVIISFHLMSYFFPFFWTLVFHYNILTVQCLNKRHFSITFKNFMLFFYHFWQLFFLSFSKFSFCIPIKKIQKSVYHIFFNSWWNGKKVNEDWVENNNF